jgi:hypothetical protein
MDSEKTAWCLIDMPPWDAPLECSNKPATCLISLTNQPLRMLFSASLLLATTSVRRKGLDILTRTCDIDRM